MPIPIHPDETWEYQLVEDRQTKTNSKGERLPDPNGTFFKLRPLRPRDEASIEDSTIDLSAKDGTLVVSGARLGQRTWETCTKGLVGWRNFDAPWDTKDQEQNLARIAPGDRHELAGAIASRSKLPPAEGD